MDIHEPVMKAIRNTGSTNVISLNTNHFGQDQGWPRRGAADSAILTYGPQLASTYTNITFDIHWYSRWSGASSAEINAYFDQIQAKGLTAFVGEIGGVPNAPGFMGQDWIATEAFFNARPDGVGVVLWGGFYEAITKNLFTAWMNNPVSATPK